MQAEEQVVSLDLDDDSLPHRIRRGHRILYVEVSPNIIPRAERTESFAVLKHLRSLPSWSTNWQTLTVTGPIDSPTCQPDVFRPHSLQPSDLVQGTPMYDLADFNLTERISDRVSKGTKDDKTVVIKIARFAHELGYLRQELKAYEVFRAHDFRHMPEIHGHVFEESSDRVVGFAMEYLEGPHAGVEDLEDCRKVLALVHRCGYILGDINRYNWVRTDGDMKVSDFEAPLSQSEANISPSDELAALPFQLSDNSGVGRR
jgi:hypothetical protein